MASYKNPINRAFNLPANKPPDYTSVVHNFEALEFLLETAFPNTLMQFTVEQERFQQAMEAIRIRNEFYVREVQPALAKLQVQGKSVTEQQLRTGLGERVFGSTVTGANEVYDHIPACEVSILAMHKELFKTAKELFPKEKFIKAAEA